MSANEKMVISRSSLLTLFAIVSSGVALAAPSPAASSFDTLIVNARIVDGTGNHIAHGMAADLVVFDPQRIGDRATFEQSMQYAEGVDYLLINGQLAIDANRPTGSLPGRVLRHVRDASALQTAVPAACRL